MGYHVSAGNRFFIVIHMIISSWDQLCSKQQWGQRKKESLTLGKQLEQEAHKAIQLIWPSYDLNMHN